MLVGVAIDWMRGLERRVRLARPPNCPIITHDHPGEISDNSKNNLIRAGYSAFRKIDLNQVFLSATVSRTRKKRTRTDYDGTNVIGILEIFTNIPPSSSSFLNLFCILSFSLLTPPDCFHIPEIFQNNFLWTSEVRFVVCRGKKMSPSSSATSFVVVSHMIAILLLATASQGQLMRDNTSTPPPNSTVAPDPAARMWKKFHYVSSCSVSFLEWSFLNGCPFISFVVCREATDCESCMKVSFAKVFD